MRHKRKELKVDEKDADIWAFILFNGLSVYLFIADKHCEDQI